MFASAAGSWRPGVSCPLTSLQQRPLQEIKSKITAVQQAAMKIGEHLAGKGGDGSGGGDSGAGGSGENVQDAEVKDK